MANLFQMLSNGVNNLRNNVQNANFFNRLANQTSNGELPYIQPIQMREDGSVYEIPQPVEYKPNAIQKAGNKLTDALLGQKAASTDNIGIGDGNTFDITASETPRTGGILRDIAGGYNENRNTPISLNNFGQNQDKGIAYKIGEGLGSVGRFIDSPLGRGVLTGAAIGLLGGAPAEMLAYGGTATALNQGNRLRDRAYRQQLVSTMQDSLRNGEGWNDLTPEEQNARLQSVADQINGMRGYMADDVYKNIIAGQQLRDNAEWRKANLEQQRIAQEEAREDRALQRELTRRGQDLSYSTSMANIGLQRDRMNQAYELAAKKAGADKKTMQALTENNQTLADIDEGLRLIQENPSAYTWLKGKLGADIANRIDPKGVKTRTQIDNITAVYRKWLTGAQMSDQERKAYERFLPAPSDNAQIVQQKLEGMRNSIQRKNDVMMSGLQIDSSQGIDNDPLGIL